MTSKPKTLDREGLLLLTDEDRTARRQLAETIQNWPIPGDAYLLFKDMVGRVITSEDAYYLCQLYGRQGKNAVVQVLTSGVKIPIERPQYQSTQRRSRGYRGRQRARVPFHASSTCPQ
eukprot:Blabericola_migrator_1__2563@NODE_1724_length_3921_cov_660_524131_g1114_i0_p6_GENE_NODE_1724_length_3921_cov_660_524131_g1114_i0NODE_1724_length_3921_cov_660_524131_g1114_i0_p6_ORF_typecomplete_len118_score10_58_NODE_1724_length_3921_cov_660_524131_g1114_i015791932